MITGAINLGVWTLIIFFLGMYKPQWPLFFMKNPSRFIIIMITTIFVMITFTLYGEGLRQEKLELAAKQSVTESSIPAPVPVPVPIPAPEKTTIK
ncbi:MAG: hypothetical protein NTV66_09700 [Methylococcales bacterium]|jgi:hypothetical protein|nr:hypothetical protein [Methylococcales bacterium]